MSLSSSASILEVLDSLFKDKKKPIPLHEPLFEGNEWTYVKECLDSTFVSSVGKFVDRFERDLETFTASKHAVACVNGTSALQMACKVVGVQAGEEVLVPALTFVGTANAVSHCGAYAHFVDSEEEFLGIDTQNLETYLESIVERKNDQCINKKTGRRIAAMIGVHIFGHPLDMEGLLKISQKYQLPFIEDCAESLGSYYKGKHTGTQGCVGVLSFNGNKIITTGGGGALLIQDEELAKKAKHLTTTAKTPHPWDFYHDEIAYNFRMPNLNAALGCAQLEALPNYIERKRELARVYKEAFSKVEGLKFLEESGENTSNYWLNAILLDKDQAPFRNEILETLHSAKYLCRPIWIPMHKLPMYENHPRMDLSTCESLVQRTINLPSSVSLVR